MKKTIREKYKQLRNQLSESYRNQSSRKIAEEILSSSDYQQANVIFIYHHFGSEVETKLIIEKALQDGKKVGLPVTQSGGRMQAFEVSSLEDLQLDNFGISTPNPETAIIISPEQIDLVIVPLLAFNGQGHRLGYGKGYYDRYLPHLRSNCKKIGIAFSEQFCESIPIDVHDYPLDKILTEKGLYSLTTRVETHSHSHISMDCDRHFDKLVEEANCKNFKYITLTDHYDKDMVDGKIIPQYSLISEIPPDEEWTFPIEEYIKFCTSKKEEFSLNSNSTQLLIGLELGFVDYLAEDYNQLLEKYPFDCVVSSVHTINHYDFAAIPESLFYLTQNEAYTVYLKTLISMVQSKLDFDILAHFDYITRYAPYDDPKFYYSDYPDLFDELFQTMIEKKICLEANTRTRYRNVLSGEKDPGITDLSIYQRYYDLGGRMICFATDAHQEGDLYRLVSDSIQEMKKIGFTHGTYFINREAKFYEL